MDRDKPEQQAQVVEGKEPYEPPQILSEEAFETLALACGKAHGFRCAVRGGLRS